MTAAFGAIGAPLKDQFEAFLDEYRDRLRATVEGLDEEQVRRQLVPSKTTLLGVVKHASYLQQVWFDHAITGRPRSEIGIPEDVQESWVIDDGDTIASVLATFDEVCARSRAAVADLDVDHVVSGHRAGPMPLRWIYLQALRELTHHCGHADILREQIVSGVVRSA